MKRFFTLVICCCLIGTVCYKLDSITDLIVKYFSSTQAVVKEEKNKYAKDYDFEFVKRSEDFIPYNYQDLLNIFYTIINYGYDNFTFYCPVEYQDCLKDVEEISNPSNIELLTTLGNYVSPYNNFTSMKVQYDTAGEITVDVEYLYSEDDISSINDKLDDIWASLVTNDMDNKAIIYAFHDYIINNTRYDLVFEGELKAYNEKCEEYEILLEQNKKNTPRYDQIKQEYETYKKSRYTTHQASKATGPLFEGYAICSGYTDVMALVLDRLGLPNFKVASETHVWNVVYIDNQWLHIDLTWDDPVSGDDVNKNNLLHKFYLIDTPTLEEFDIQDHTFNKSMYLEFK